MELEVTLTISLVGCPNLKLSGDLCLMELRYLCLHGMVLRIKRPRIPSLYQDDDTYNKEGITCILEKICGCSPLQPSMTLCNVIIDSDSLILVEMMGG